MKHTDPQDLQTTDRPVEKLLELADYLEKYKNQFGMSRVFHKCGTPSCIAGHWLAMHGKPVGSQNMFTTAEEMGLSSPWPMFCPDDSKVALGRPATAQDAAKVIRHFALTGEEDWGVALR